MQEAQQIVFAPRFWCGLVFLRSCFVHDIPCLMTASAHEQNHDAFIQLIFAIVGAKQSHFVVHKLRFTNISLLAVDTNCQEIYKNRETCKHCACRCKENDQQIVTDEANIWEMFCKKGIDEENIPKCFHRSLEQRTFFFLYGQNENKLVLSLASVYRLLLFSVVFH